MDVDKPTVVIDAGPFMCLEDEPEHFRYFRALFERVLIAGEVADELVAKSDETPAVYLARHGILDVVQIIRDVILEPFVDQHRPPFDRGEAETISLAVQYSVPAVIEEKRGRNFANRHGVQAANMAAFVILGVARQYVSKETAQDMIDTMYRVNMFGERLYGIFLEDLKKLS
jgi:predicted nucleic acid-binding protein